MGKIERICTVYGKFRAYKMFGGISRYLGSFNTPEEAHKAYVEA